MSWVFLTGDRVYKLKKPVRYPYLDFGTLERRRFFCEEEVRLNRRLAPLVYRGVVPLRRIGGTFSLGGAQGRVVDWLVEMERLPQRDMLDERIRSGRVAQHDIEAVAARLSSFYRACVSVGAEGRAYLDHLTEEQAINREILLSAGLGTSDAAAAPVAAVDALLAEARPLIEARIAQGAIVEGHGDLRPEHVSLVRPPQIIDCLEFDRTMRIIDPYDEVNYLGLECDMLGAGWIRQVLNEAIDRSLHSRPPAGLLVLYAAFRCLLRARLSIAHRLEKPARHPGKWLPLALRYLKQAQRELVSPRYRAAPKSSRRLPGGR